MAALGRLWLAGHRIDAGRIFAGQGRRRVPLPSYPFERLRYWIEPDRAGASVQAPVQEPVQTLHLRPRLVTPFVPRDRPLEKRIAEIWRRVLGVAEVRRDDNFLDLGGDSLFATRMVALVREELGVDLPFEVLFADPTVAGTARAVEEIRAAPPPPAPSPARLAALLAEIQGLSAAELEAELAGREKPMPGR